MDEFSRLESSKKELSLRLPEARAASVNVYKAARAIIANPAKFQFHGSSSNGGKPDARDGKIHGLSFGVETVKDRTLFVDIQFIIIGGGTIARENVHFFALPYGFFNLIHKF